MSEPPWYSSFISSAHLDASRSAYFSSLYGPVGQGLAPTMQGTDRNFAVQSSFINAFPRRYPLNEGKPSRPAMDLRKRSSCEGVEGSPTILATEAFEPAD